MMRSLFALVLTLSVLPTAAFAQDASAPSKLTDQQKQTLHATFERYRAQEEQLHLQMRSQVLSVLTPLHRRELASFIGALAIEENPDMQAAAARLDRALSSYERARILAVQQSFQTQMHQVHEQMRAELQTELPARPSNWGGHPNGMPPERQQRLDAGTIVLMTLTPHMSMRPDWRGGP